MILERNSSAADNRNANTRHRRNGNQNAALTRAILWRSAGVPASSASRNEQNLGDSRYSTLGTGLSMFRPGMNFQQLTARVNKGEIDTVMVVFPDVFGRLVGKRFTGRYFVDHVAEEGTH